MLKSNGVPAETGVFLIACNRRFALNGPRLARRMRDVAVAQRRIDQISWESGPKMVRPVAPLVLVLSLGLSQAFGDEFPEAVTIRLVHPETQCERLIDLFKGTKAPHPAAAVSGWKHATGRSLGKPLEALIALANPEMVRELATFDGTRAGIGFDSADSRLRWNVTVPRDDGSVAALATALVLTEGASEPSLDGLAVDRLGRPGAPLAAGSRGRYVIAGSRPDLATALRRTEGANQASDGLVSGLHVKFDPNAFPNASSLTNRRLVEALRGFGIGKLKGSAELRDESLVVELAGNLVGPVVSDRPLDASWLDWIPADSTLAVVSIAVDPRPETWERLFQLADRLEKLDPARAEVAPLRTRLNLLALAAKINLEADFLPGLRGLTIAVLANPDGELSGAIALIHATDAPAARRIETAVIPRLVSAWIKGGDPAAGPDGVRRLGRLSGRPLQVTSRDSTILVGWGESAVSVALEAKDRPDCSAGKLIRSGWASRPPQRAGAFWPGRVRFPASQDSPWPLALPGSAPVLWHGTSDASATHDALRWSDLRGLVRRFLERIPITPPPGS